MHIQVPEVAYFEHELEKIENSKCWGREQVEDILAHVALLWSYPDCAGQVRDGLWVFATRGWSDNERLISALYRNWYFISQCSQLELSGGLYIFAIGEEAKKELELLEDFIVKWAWAGKEEVKRYQKAIKECLK